jgi:hypothetical protein
VTTEIEKAMTGLDDLLYMVDLAAANSLIGTVFAGTYVNDFIQNGGDQAGLCAGGCSLSNAARRSEQLVRPELGGRDGAVLGLRDDQLVSGIAFARPLQWDRGNLDAGKCCLQCQLWRRHE